MKNTFSLVSTSINWSSLSLPTPRMRKANKSCMVSAAHPLVTRRCYRLFRFSSLRYVMKGGMFISQPPLRNDRRYLRGECPSPRWSSVGPVVKIALFRNIVARRVRHTNSSVVGCLNQHQFLYSVPATGYASCWFVCVCLLLHIGLLQYEGQYKAGFASTLTLVKGSVPTIPDPATAPEPQVSVAVVW